MDGLALRIGRAALNQFINAADAAIGTMVRKADLHIRNALSGVKKRKEIEMAEERERARALLFLVLLVLVILGGLLGVFMRKIGHEQDTGSAFLQNLPLGTTVKEWQEGYSHITVTIQKSAVIEEQKKEK